MAFGLFTPLNSISSQAIFIGVSYRFELEIVTGYRIDHKWAHSPFIPNEGALL